ncbi:MAG: hypothetical protein ABGX27_04435, partial [Desulfurobacteriaceae bacterium]
MSEKFQNFGEKTIILSFYLLALTIPLSIAGDNIAVAVGGIGLILSLLFNREKLKAVPLKPILP